MAHTNQLIRFVLQPENIFFMDESGCFSRELIEKGGAPSHVGGTNCRPAVRLFVSMPAGFVTVPSKRRVAVYSSTPSPSRNPHMRQKRSPEGISA
jgi:hypothetical protein